ncbi:hypothetical protein RND81_13G213300 [Saponaria officinalis]|uniref:WEB family protein n=1 Tax=Saponaria officinalis TaxID=3572 RepID=A0AAW1H3N0_SAPOF
MEAEEGGVMVKGRAIIDTRPPFRSVREAVALFGERVLVGEIYAKQLKEMEPKMVTSQKPQNNTSTIIAVSSELEETKKKLQKEREEGNHIATCLKSLKQELEQTKRELWNFKSTKNASIQHPKMINPEIEELNIVENSIRKPHFEEDGYYGEEYQKKKIVTFASPPSLTREIVQDNVVDDGSFARLGRSSSFRREFKEGKKKPINPIVGWIFPRKKKNNQL